MFRDFRKFSFFLICSSDGALPTRRERWKSGSRWMIIFHFLDCHKKKRCKSILIHSKTHLIISFWHVFWNHLSHGKRQSQNDQDLTIKCSNCSLKGIAEKKIQWLFCDSFPFWRIFLANSLAIERTKWIIRPFLILKLNSLPHIFSITTILYGDRFGIFSEEIRDVFTKGLGHLRHPGGRELTS